MMWQPYGVGYGWDPFYNGAWAWYPGFGYTWVSTYPWGWTPYRYGSWTFMPNFGWAWQPGTWNTWYTVPPVYNPPPFFHGPKPPPPVTVVGGGGTAIPHPTVVVDNGLIRDPRRFGPAADGFLGGRGAGTRVAAPLGYAAPAPGTGIAAPGSPLRGPRPEHAHAQPGSRRTWHAQCARLAHAAQCACAAHVGSDGWRTWRRLQWRPQQWWKQTAKVIW